MVGVELMEYGECRGSIASSKMVQAFQDVGVVVTETVPC